MDGWIATNHQEFIIRRSTFRLEKLIAIQLFRRFPEWNSVAHKRTGRIYLRVYTELHIYIYCPIIFVLINHEEQ
jgi:hypothetical protein